jgi:hypothetical protein
MAGWMYRASFSTLALDEGERPASGPCRFTPGERAPGTHYTAGSLGTRADLEAVKKRKISCSCRESNPNLSATQPVASVINTFLVKVAHSGNFLF